MSSPRPWIVRSISTLTASSVMNSFFIPALAGQVYAMPGMQHAAEGRDQQVRQVRGLLREL
jgi:heme/copper-type cytochrome/quinol oxidase subunit 2